MLGGLGEPGARDHRYISLFERVDPGARAHSRRQWCELLESSHHSSVFARRKQRPPRRHGRVAGDPLHAAISTRQARATTTGFNQVVGLLGLPIRRQGPGAGSR
jgi:hypothetical protein